MKVLQKYFLLALLAGAVLAGCRDDDDAPCCDATNPECPGISNANFFLRSSPWRNPATTYGEGGGIAFVLNRIRKTN